MMDGLATDFGHVSVLADAVRSLMNYSTAEKAIDCTAGGGGHMALALAEMPKGAKILGIDRDPVAIAHLNRRFAAEISVGRVYIVHAPFSQLHDVLENHPEFSQADTILADLGVSSPQIDDDSRGFSFMRPGPLDMRMNQTASAPTAADIVNQWSEVDLTRLFQRYGEEPKAKFIARAIVQRRTSKLFSTTDELSEVIVNSVHYKERSRKHPATRVFQALRVQVNNEMEELATLLQAGFSHLRRSGRLGIITFHSLEDRAVKSEFRRLSGHNEQSAVLSRLPLTEERLTASIAASGAVIKPFPAIPDELECESNPRARSAKLRVIERIN